MEVSQDDINDWAQCAAELESLVETIGQSLLDEQISLAADVSDLARRLAHHLAQCLYRAGVDPRNITQHHWTYNMGSCLDGSIGRTESSVRAADALEKAAMHVLALEREHGITHGIGETLADFAADLNLVVHGTRQELG